MNEDKRAIVQKLKELLQITRAGSRIKELVLDEQEKWVTIVYEHGTKRVDVSGNSGIALIRDVAKKVI